MKPPPAKSCPACGERYEGDVLFCPKDGTPLANTRTASFQTTENDAYVGVELAGQIRIKHLIGIGSMGRVYRAFQAGIERDVAVKILHRELSGNSELVGRFHREAKVASRLVHPNVVQVLMTGTVPFRSDPRIGGEMYLVMEHLDGISLLSALAAAGNKSDSAALPLPRALHIVLQLCDAVGEAHVQGIVHRDLKPENVMLIRRGEDADYVKVLDFGIARIDWANQSMATQAGLIFGTAKYISPEGAGGEGVGPPADVYSIATILYQCLAGRAPFEDESPVALLVQHTHAVPPELRSIPRASYVPAPIAEVVMQNLAKKPSARAQDARAFGRDLVAAMRASGLDPEEIIAHSTLLVRGAVRLASQARTKNMDMTPELAKVIAQASKAPPLPAPPAPVATPAPGAAAAGGAAKGDAVHARPAPTLVDEPVPEAAKEKPAEAAAPVSASASGAAPVSASAAGAAPVSASASGAGPSSGAPSSGAPANAILVGVRATDTMVVHASELIDVMPPPLPEPPPADQDAAAALAADDASQANEEQTIANPAGGVAAQEELVSSAAEAASEIGRASQSGPVAEAPPPIEAAAKPQTTSPPVAAPVRAQPTPAPIEAPAKPQTTSPPIAAPVRAQPTPPPLEAPVRAQPTPAPAETPAGAQAAAAAVAQGAAANALDAAPAEAASAAPPALEAPSPAAANESAAPAIAQAAEASNAPAAPVVTAQPPALRTLFDAPAPEAVSVLPPAVAEGSLAPVAPARPGGTQVGEALDGDSIDQVLPPPAARNSSVSAVPARPIAPVAPARPGGTQVGEALDGDSIDQVLPPPAARNSSVSAVPARPIAPTSGTPRPPELDWNDEGAKPGFQSTMQGTAVESAPVPPPRAQRRPSPFRRAIAIIAIGAAAAASAIGIHHYYRTAHTSESSDSLDELVEQARECERTRSWDSPPGANVKDITARALEQAPNDPRILDIRHDAAEKIVTEALGLKYAGDHEGAVRLAKLAVELNPTLPTAQRLVAELEAVAVAEAPGSATAQPDAKSEHPGTPAKTAAPKGSSKPALPPTGSLPTAKGPSSSVAPTPAKTGKPGTPPPKGSGGAAVLPQPTGPWL